MVFGFLRRRRRERLRATPFPDEWRRVVEANIPPFARMSEAEKLKLLGHAQVLLAEKHFEGCGGLEMTDEIRVTIAVQAARLLLNRPDDYFPTVVSILVYPAALSHAKRETLEGGIIRESEMAISGLATGSRNVIILTWDSASHGASAPDDGLDVVLHEFAHALDYEDRSFDGTPPMESGVAYRAWGRLMQAEYDTLRQALDEGRETVLDPYATTDPAEFFAVLTEHFFERPRELRERHPALYAAMQGFYRQDPAGDGA